MPLTSEYNAVRLVISLVLVLLVFTRPAPPRLANFPITLFLMASAGLFSGAAVSTLVEGSAAWDSVAHELMRIGYYSLIVASALRLGGRLSTLVLGCQGLLLLHLGIQVLQLMRPELINDWIASNYPTDTVHLELATYSWPNFRSGSIYVNPNVYAVFPPMFLAVFLQAARRSAMKQVAIWASLSVASVILTGSRMGLILTLAVIVVWWSGVGERSPHRWRGALPVGGTLIASLILFEPSLATIQDRGRSFDIEGAFMDSFDTKMSLFLERVAGMNPVYWPFGELASHSAGPQDMELAHIAIGFGLVGIFWYAHLLTFLARASRERLSLISSSYILIILLASLGASTVLNLAIFPAFLMVMLVDWRQPASRADGGDCL